MKNAIPLLGGFNDGKYVRPKGLRVLRLAHPTSCGNTFSKDSEPEFGYETYTLRLLFISKVKIRVYAVEGLTNEKIVQKLVSGYKQKKSLTLLHI